MLPEKPAECFFFKAILCGSNPQHFPFLAQRTYSFTPWIWNADILRFFLRDSRRLKTFPFSSFGKRCTTPLMRQLSSGGGPFLDLRRICGQLIYMFKIAHYSINFPWHSVFAAPHTLGFAVTLSKFTNSDVAPGVTSTRLVFLQLCIEIYYQRKLWMFRRWKYPRRDLLHDGCPNSPKFPSNPYRHILSRACSTLSYHTFLSFL